MRCFLKCIQSIVKPVKITLKLKLKTRAIAFGCAIEKSAQLCMLINSLFATDTSVFATKQYDSREQILRLKK